MKRLIKRWLGIDSIENRINQYDLHLLNAKAKELGVFILKKHLNKPDLPLPTYRGKDIQQD